MTSPDDGSTAVEDGETPTANSSVADTPAGTTVDDDASPSGEPTTRTLVEPSEAFQALGNEVRMGILDAMLERADGDGPSRAAFSDLHEASAVETSAGFAYHLDQLVGSYLRKCGTGAGSGCEADAQRSDDRAGYELTFAGERAARAISTGTYTRRVDRSRTRLDEPCPFCREGTLTASVRDNVVGVTCRNCERPLLRLGVPPSGLLDHEDVPSAVDRYHRSRFALARAGSCPDCAGPIDAEVTFPNVDTEVRLPDSLEAQPQAAFTCESCEVERRCPVALSLLDHPEVVSFYRERGESVRDRRLWNVGPEWTETVRSTEPFVLEVAITLGDERLELYVDERADVATARREAVER